MIVYNSWSNSGFAKEFIVSEFFFFSVKSLITYYILIFSLFSQKSKHGLTGIGASPYMSNFNVMLETNNLEVGQNIARKIRERTGGNIQFKIFCASWPWTTIGNHLIIKTAKFQTKIGHIIRNWNISKLNVSKCFINKSWSPSLRKIN